MFGAEHHPAASKRNPPATTAEDAVAGDAGAVLLKMSPAEVAAARRADARRRGVVAVLVVAEQRPTARRLNEMMHDGLDVALRVGGAVRRAPRVCRGDAAVGMGDLVENVLGQLRRNVGKIRRLLAASERCRLAQLAEGIVHRPKLRLALVTT